MKPRPHPLSIALLGALLTLFGAACGGPPPALGLICLPQDVEGVGPWTTAELEEFQALESHGPERSRLAEFGRVTASEALHHTFRLVNADPAPVRLKRVSPSCTCTVPRVRWTAPDGSTGEGSMSTPGEIALIPSGAVVEIEARVNPSRVQRKNIDKLVTIHLLTDSPRTPALGLELHLVVEEPFRLVPDPFDLGTLPESGGGHGELVVLQHESASSLHALSGLADLPPGIEASLREDPRDQGRRRWSISVELLPPLDRGRLVRTFHVETVGPDGQPGPEQRILVTALVVPDVSVHPRTAVVWDGSPAAVELRAHLAGQRVRVLSHRFEGEGGEALSLMATPRPPLIDGASNIWDLSLVLSGEPELPLSRGKVVLELDDSQHPSIEFDYVLHASPPSN